MARLFEAETHGYSGLYVMNYVDEGICKIGVTSDLPARFDCISGYYWGKIEVSYFCFPYLSQKVGRSPIDDENIFKMSAVSLERECHAKLKELGLHLRGEYFELFPEEAEALVKKVADLGGYKLASPVDIAAADMSSIVIPQERDIYLSMANAAGVVIEFMAKQEMACKVEC